MRDDRPRLDLLEDLHELRHRLARRVGVAIEFADLVDLRAERITDCLFLGAPHVLHLLLVIGAVREVDHVQLDAERVRGLSKEGLVAAWEGEQAGYLEDARRVQLNQARRQLSVLKARFLADLGLAPAKFELSGDISFGDGILPVADDVRLDDLVLGALERHPLLSMADRQLVMKENAVRQAFCDFLPTLAGFGKETWSGNEVMTVTPNLVYGFNAAWKLFDGTAIAKYKSEKVEREKTSLERENTFLSVIVNVAAAEAAWRDAGEGAAISRRAFEVAKAKFLDYDARSREGLVPLGDALDARAAMDLAEVDFVKGKYRELCAKAALAFAAGTLPAPEAAGQ